MIEFWVNVYQDRNGTYYGNWWNEFIDIEPLPIVPAYRIHVRLKRVVFQ